MLTNVLQIPIIVLQAKQPALTTMVVSHASVMLVLMVMVLRRAQVVLDVLISMNALPIPMTVTPMQFAPMMLVHLPALAIPVGLVPVKCVMM